jgi:hypothetical protein
VAFVARRAGVLVWPDVAIVFVATAAGVAVHDLATEKPKVEPRAPLASFVLPAEQVQAPTSELRAPAQIEVVAVTPTSGANATHAATRFTALLLTRIPKTGPTGPVRVLVSRGKDDSTAMALARHRVDSTKFFLLPSADCFFAPAQGSLSHHQTEAILETYGFSAGKAKQFARSFSGLVDFVRINPGRTFYRYFSRGRTGSFVTDWRFKSSGGAQRGLALPDENKASEAQTVSARRPTMALRGRIRGASDGAPQYIVLRQECFDFGPGHPVPSS